MTFHLGRSEGHLGWDRELSPVREVASGDVLELELADCFDGQLGPGAGPADVVGLDADRANPLTGPVRVEGAEPGDVLAVEILAVEPATTGVTAQLPGFGLLADDFPDPHLVRSTVGVDEVDFGGLARLPRAPFLGTVGLAPAAPGPHAAIPPRRVGGNLDCRDVRPGARLLLPVEVPGALLSAGDAHAAQGDGEVCGTAVEVAAVARLRVEVRRGRALTAPEIELPAAPPVAVGPRHVTTGVGGDLRAAAADATRAMIAWLSAEASLAPADAYALCSVAGHLRIAEVVDAPHWVVAMELDRDVLG